MRPDRRPDSRVLFGLPIDRADSMDDVVALGAEAVRSRRRMLVGVVNAAKIVNLRRDALLRDSLLDCDVILADGQSVVWASRLLGRPLPERVTGIDLFEACWSSPTATTVRSTCSGRQPRGAGPACSDRIRSGSPRSAIAGAAGRLLHRRTRRPTSPATSADPGADMLFLGMTSPKKEIFLGEYGDDARRAGAARGRRLVRRPRRRDQAGAAAWQRLGLEWAVPPAAGATAPVAALPRHQQRVRLARDAERASRADSRRHGHPIAAAPGSPPSSGQAPDPSRSRRTGA